MKRYKILFFLLLLCSIQPSWACINDPEDWNNYEGDFENCIDGGELDEVVCTPNHDDEEDGSSADEYEDEDTLDGGELDGVTCTSTSHNDSDDEENLWDNDDYDQYDDDDDNNDVTSHSNLPENHLKLISTKLPRSWIKTYDKNSCVVTSMEYIWNIINQKDPPIVFNRFIYESKYEEWHPDYNPMNDPIKLNDLERLIGDFFEYHELDKEESYKEAILNNDPILTIIEGISEGLPCLHEITIVGFDDEKEKYYYIDPSSGLYNYIGFDDIIGPSYCVTGNN